MRNVVSYRMIESSSTQTCEPWVRTTCVSKSRCKKPNRISFCSNYDKAQQAGEYHHPCNDGYNRISEYSNRYKNRCKISADMKTSTSNMSCNKRGVCCSDTMTDRIYAEMGLQTGVSCCKTVTSYCPTSEDRDRALIKDPEFRNEASVPSSAAKPKQKLNAITNADRVKKSTLKKKRSVKKIGHAAAGIKTAAGKRATGTSSSPSKPRKLAAVKSSECSPLNAVTRPAAYPTKLSNVAKTEKNKTKKTALTILPAKIVKHVKVAGGMSGTTSHAAIKDGKLEKEKRAAGVEVQPECSARCQGVDDAVQQRDLAGSSSVEITKPSNIVRRQTAYHVNELALLKSLIPGEGSSSSENSSDQSDKALHSDKDERGGRESDPSIPRPAAAAVVEEEDEMIQNADHESVEILQAKPESVSSHESGDKSNTPVIQYAAARDEDDEYRSPPNYRRGKLNIKRSAPMTIWHCMRKRYANTSPSMQVSSDRRSCSKDPFLSLFLSCSSSRNNF